MLNPVGRPPPTHVGDGGALGARLRRLRRERGLSLAGLAFPGCSASYVCLVEAGDRVPSRAVLTQLAHRLGVAVEELAGRDAAGSIPAATILLAEMSARLGEPDA